ncbi:hypothetical protein [Sphingomonas sp.]|jgi:hypothetical protein|uniref:hypothetical protein n=1 Tax=Sphingomonas sp. TaxID=28214 RepID=UPI0035C857F1
MSDEKRQNGVEEAVEELLTDPNSPEHDTGQTPPQTIDAEPGDAEPGDAAKDGR